MREVGRAGRALVDLVGRREADVATGPRLTPDREGRHSLRPRTPDGRGSQSSTDG